MFSILPVIFTCQMFNMFLREGFFKEENIPIAFEFIWFTEIMIQIQQHLLILEV